MNIVMITVNDPAGMGIAFTNAINRYTEHTCRLISSQDRYGIDFGKDIHLPDIYDDDFDEVEDILLKADIFHFHMLSDENMHLGPLVIRDYAKGKSILHHHHGHPDYLLNVERYNTKYKKLGRKVIVSTPNLLKVADDSIWQPNLVPLFDTPYLPRFDRSLSKSEVRICQAPTRKYDKHTACFSAVMQQLQRENTCVKSIILERMNHLECLLEKKKCHIVFDHMRGWFGISSLESLSQGKPVVAGLDEWNSRCIKEFTGLEELPWCIARDETGLYSVLAELISDDKKRQYIGEQSRLFMERCWSEQRVLKVLDNVYRSL